MAFRGQEGQLAIVIPIALTLSVGGALLWGYNHLVQTRAVSVKSGMESVAIANGIAGRIKRFLIQPDTSPACGATKSALDSYRNFIAPAVISNWKYPRQSGFLDPTGCLILPAEAAAITSANIVLERSAAPDMASLSSPLQATISVSVVRPGMPRSDTNLTLKFQFQVGSMATYSLILLGDSGATKTSPQINVSTGAKFQVAGRTFHAGKNPFDLSIIGSSDPNLLSFEDTVEIRAANLDIPDPKQRVDLGTIGSVYKGGLEVGAFHSVPRLPLPLESPAWDPYVWQQKLDYSYLYGPAGPGVDSSSATQYAPIPDVAGPLGNPSATAMAGINSASGTPIDLYIDSNAKALSILPTPTTPAIVPNLASTCGAALDLIPTMIYQRIDDDLTLNFSETDDVFCGLVVARSVTINTPVTTQKNYGIYGIIVTKKINVNGNGTVFVLNPGDAHMIPGVTLPPGQSQSNIFVQFQFLATNLAQNFFSPTFVSSPVASFSPMAAAYPGGIGGYAAPCGSGNPNPTTWYCLKASFAKPDYSSLFSPYTGNLAYSVRVTQ